MGLRRQAWAGCLLAGMLGMQSGRAQTIASHPTPPGTYAITPGSGDALHAMSRMAGLIFAGQVTAIRRHGGLGGSSGVVEIDFAVDEAIRGVVAGSYTVKEWGGLWTAGFEPLRVGQRYLMLLHAPGAAGMTSPVGGSDGAIPIRGGGARAADAVGTGTLALAEGSEVDLRWVAAHAVRTLSYKGEESAHPTSLPVAIQAETTMPRARRVDVAAPSRSDSADAHGADYSAVLRMLRSWDKDDHVAR